MTRHPCWAEASLLLRFRDYTQHHTLQDSLGLVISSSQRPIPNKTQSSHQTDIYDRHLLCPWRDLNPQFPANELPHILPFRPHGQLKLLNTVYTHTFILTTLSAERFFHFSVVPLKIGIECSLIGRKMLPVLSLILCVFDIFRGF